MIRSFRYSLRPTKTQEAMLNVWLMLCRELYNAALQERRDAYRKTGKSPSRYDQYGDLAEIRRLRPEFTAVPIAVLRGTLNAIDRAFKAFFRRCKNGETPGHPRFKGRNRARSIPVDAFNGVKPICAGGTRVHIPLIGKVKFKLHRPLLGTPKTMRITHENGHWFVSILCVDVPAKPIAPTGREVGIDLGLTTLAMSSEDGDPPFENSRALRSARIETERAQRRVSRRKRGSNRRRKARRILARKHAHIANVRREVAIGLARTLVRKYDVIYVEKLNLVGLSRGFLAKSVADAGWGISMYWLNVKAEEAGRLVVPVDPAGTSIDCSGCGERVPKGLGDRTHHCSRCGLVLCRDRNAARNIKTRGMRVRREALDHETSMIREGRVA